MPRRLLSVTCCSFSILIGALTLSPLQAEDSPSATPATSSSAEVPPPAPAENPGATYKLAYKFGPGEVVRYETQHNVKFVSQFSGNQETATNKTETRKIYRVIGVNPDGSADLELVIEWVRMKADFGGGGLPIEFDSKDPGAKSQAKFADILRNVGKPQARLKCAANGKVISVKEMKLVTPAAAGTQSVELKDVSGRDDFNFLTVFPDEPIPVGKTWAEKSEVKVTVEDKLKETIQLQRTYKLDSVEGDIATVSFKTSVLTPVKNPTIAIQLIQRETSGKLQFDMTRGAMITRNVDSDKSVINPAGNNTAMHSSSYLLERIITSTAAISDVPATSAKQ
ncbi:MAG: DUF6263 family protein [Planctomycetota bacterium]